MKIINDVIITNDIFPFTLFMASAWEYFNTIKEQAVAMGFSMEQKKLLWDEINNLFKQAGFGEKCYGWYIG